MEESLIPKELTIKYLRMCELGEVWNRVLGDS
jgi:hypothetical protein